MKALLDTLFDFIRPKRSYCAIGDGPLTRTELEIADTSEEVKLLATRETCE